jgi:hypothetical protein
MQVIYCCNCHHHHHRRRRRRRRRRVLLQGVGRLAYSVFKKILLSIFSKVFLPL